MKEKQAMPSIIHFTLSAFTVASLLASLFLLNEMKKLRLKVEEKKFEIETVEENLWQLNHDLSRSILEKLRLMDRLSSSQV